MQLSESGLFPNKPTLVTRTLIYPQGPLHQLLKPPSLPIAREIKLPAWENCDTHSGQRSGFSFLFFGENGLTGLSDDVSRDQQPEFPLGASDTQTPTPCLPAAAGPQGRQPVTEDPVWNPPALGVEKSCCYQQCRLE